MSSNVDFNLTLHVLVKYNRVCLRSTTFLNREFRRGYRGGFSGTFPPRDTKKKENPGRSLHPGCKLLIIITLNLIVSPLLILNKNSLINREKNTPFECGFDPLSNARMPFSNQFFIVTLLFLIFDVEIIIVIPVTLIINYSYLIIIRIIFIFVLIILILGL
ncbi:uncharacterized protein LOC143187730 [Calliopsis andreniformis]|uniref:uncharacterized protein LOC143187730 n=1 Tax=Calliopsis andreniformis TaxID=337506 RepID=UPI003FCD06EE